VDVDAATNKAVVRLVPRLDLQAMADRVRGACVHTGCVNSSIN
jgi:hypothetical protein